MNTLRAVVMAALHIAIPLGGLWWSLSHSRRSIAFAFWINWALMLFACVIWTIVPIRFARRYYDVFPFERRGVIYERLGVRGFQKFLRIIRFHGPAPFPRYSRAAGGLARLTADTEGSETAHAMIFLVVIGLAIDMVRRGWWDTACWLMLFNVLLNAYPVFSMRHIRARAAACARLNPL